MSKVEFFLVFVIELFHPNFGRVSLFLQRGDPCRKIGPFVNLRDQKKYINNLSADDKNLLKYLYDGGLIEGRYISNRFRYIDDISDVIFNHKNIFVRSSKFGSVRKASRKDKTYIEPKIISALGEKPLGVISRGLIDIIDEGGGRILWEYEGVDQPINFCISRKAQFFEKSTGDIFQRNVNAEVELLLGLSKSLGLSFDKVSKGLVDDLDILNIIKYPLEKWGLIAENKNLSAGIACFDDSGIAWFDDKEDGCSKVIDYDVIAEAYLKGRKRIDINGKLVFISPQDITNEGALRMATYASSNILFKDIAKIKKNFALQERKDLVNKLSINGFRAELKCYQADGVLWLSKLFDLGFGGVLADEMGLGKTVQTLAFIVRQKFNRVLIVSPASIVPNWISEINKFIINVSVSSDKNLDRDGIFVISYQRALRNLINKDIKQFDVVILDEGQFVKNVHTKTASALRNIPSRMRLVLTGTPIENSVNDLWAHLTFTNEILLEPFEKLSRKFGNFAKSKEAAELTVKAFGSLILRRTKKEVKLGLPPMLVNIVYCEMGSEQREIYEKTLGVFKHMLKKGVGARVSSIALEALLRLRQCCSFPMLLPSSLNPEFIKESSKLNAALDIVDNNVQDGKKTIIFSQFRLVSDAIENALICKNIGFVRLDGDTLDREVPVVKFQNDKNIKVIIIGFRAGGVGLNLTAAESVILFDPWWNPAAENQAFARAHRIGQNKTVVVSKLICINSIEEKMLKLIEEKGFLADSLESVPVNIELDDIFKLIEY